MFLFFDLESVCNQGYNKSECLYYPNQLQSLGKRIDVNLSVCSNISNSFSKYMLKKNAKSFLISWTRFKCNQSTSVGTKELIKNAAKLFNVESQDFIALPNKASVLFEPKECKEYKSKQKSIDLIYKNQNHKCTESILKEFLRDFKDPQYFVNVMIWVFVAVFVLILICFLIKLI